MRKHSPFKKQIISVFMGLLFQSFFFFHGYLCIEKLDCISYERNVIKNSQTLLLLDFSAAQTPVAV